MSEVREGKGAYGSNAASGDYEDLVMAGVIDPTTFMQVPLQNSASVASLMLIMAAIVAERPKREATGAGMGDGLTGMEM